MFLKQQMAAPVKVFDGLIGVLGNMHFKSLPYGRECVRSNRLALWGQLKSIEYLYLKCELNSGLVRKCC